MPITQRTEYEIDGLDPDIAKQDLARRVADVDANRLLNQGKAASAQAAQAKTLNELFEQLNKLDSQVQDLTASVVAAQTRSYNELTELDGEYRLVIQRLQDPQLNYTNVLSQLGLLATTLTQYKTVYDQQEKFQTDAQNAVVVLEKHYLDIALRLAGPDGLTPQEVMQLNQAFLPFDGLLPASGSPSGGNSSSNGGNSSTNSGPPPPPPQPPLPREPRVGPHPH